MILGHGDDTYKYDKIDINFSSNIYNHFNHGKLFSYLSDKLSNVIHYPEPVPASLEKSISRLVGIEPDEVMVTNGVTEAIYLIAQTFHGNMSVIFQPTFSEYADACVIHKHKICNVYSLDNLTNDTQMMWICNPNNPTGQVIERDKLMSLISEHKSVLFVIDASYAPFTCKPLPETRELCEFPNVLTLHSLTKMFSVPGIRIGYVTANSGLLQQIRLQRMPWSVNQIAIDAGDYLIRHKEDYTIDVGELMSERERVSKELERLGVIDVWPSDSHMILCRLRIGKASALKSFLQSEYHLLIRDAGNFEGLDCGCFRIAVQSRAEDDLLLKGIQQWIMQ